MKIVLQDGIKDCGICCLLSVIRFYGGDVSKEYLRELTHTNKDGVSLFNLVETAKMLGFEAMGVTGNLEDIDVNNLPCIVHFIVNKNYRHFVVLYQMNKTKQQVTLMDPAKGKKTISFAEYRLLSSNAYLFLKPKKKLPIMKNKNKIYKMIKITLGQNKMLWFSIVFFTFSFFVLNFICTLHFKYILNLSINYQLSSPILWISYIIGILYLLKNSNLLIRNILMNKWSAILDYEITINTYKQVLLLPYLYYKNRTTGEILSRFKDLNTIRSFVSNLFCILSTDFISIILFLTLMFFYNKRLTIMITIICALFMISTLLLTNYKKKQERIICKNQDTTNSYIINGIHNVDTIKGFHLEKRLIDKFSLQYHSFLERNYLYSRFFEFYYFVKNNMNDFILLSIYGWGSYHVIQGTMSLANLIIYQSFYSYFTSCFYRLISLIENYSSYKVASERVEDLYRMNKDNFMNHYFYLPYTLEGPIQFQDLSYKVGSKELFHQLNLTIQKGEKVLLCGESGSGKSTLLKMLLRYIDVEYSKISIAGIDINHYHLENIRSHITYVTSNEYLFTDTLRNNILMYKDQEEETFQKICKICLIDEIIKNHMLGYDTLIEEDGFNFSNGERQRIILARSIMRDSSIYIFDEALSGIDIQKEKKILEGIFEYLKNKTIIVISHRFHNKKVFDRILKLEGGIIHENMSL